VLRQSEPCRTRTNNPKRFIRGPDYYSLSATQRGADHNHPQPLKPIGNIPAAEAEEQYHVAADIIDMAARLAPATADPTAQSAHN